MGENFLGTVSEGRHDHCHTMQKGTLDDTYTKFDLENYHNQLRLESCGTTSPVNPVPGPIPVERGNMSFMIGVEVQHALDSYSQCCAPAEGYQFAGAALDSDHFYVFGEKA